MMQWIRGRAGSIIVKVLFGLLIISFGFWGVYTRSDYFQSQSPDTVIATVGDRSIRADNLQQVLQVTLERLREQYGAIDPQQVKQLGVVDSLLRNLIDRSLLDQQAARLGLEVSDETIRRAIYDNPAFKGPDGKFDRQRFAQLLMMNRTSEDQLVARLRSEIPRSELLQAVTTGAGASRPVVDALYRYRNEKRLADVVAFPAAAVSDTAAPSEDELNKFYEAHPELFNAPEYRGFTVVSVSPTDLEEQGAIAEDRLRKEYEQRKDEFETAEKREIEQILAPSEEKAKEAADAVAAGKDWKEVATGLGQDPDTVDLGLLNRQEIPHELGDVAFDLPLDQLSQPVKSPLGWHLLRVTKIEPAATQSFEEVKPKLEAALKLQDASDRLDKIGNKADDALAGGTPLAEVAAKYGLKTTTIAGSDATAHDPDGKPVALPVAPDEILKTVFATKQGDTSRIIDAGDGSIFAVHVDTVTAPRVRPLADLKDKVVAAWQDEQKRAAATKQSAALLAAVTADLPLAKAAGDKGLTLLAALPLSRNAKADQTVPPGLVAKLFAAKLGDVVTVDEPDGSYVAQLKEVQSPETVPDEEAAKLTEQLAKEAKEDIAGAFTEALRRRFPVEIQREALDRMF
jgi:peptidyl-prolyl cis-trans isomerase D